MDKPFWKQRTFRSWIKYIIALLIFVVSIGFIGENSIRKRIQRKQEINQLQTKIAEQQKKFKEDNQKLEKLKNDPAEVRRVAREKYYMKTNDEDVFIIEDKE